jgi:hypothetical protein
LELVTAQRKVDAERVARLVGQGFSRTEVARIMLISTKTVMRVMKDPGMLDLARSVFEEDDREPGAAEVLRRLLTSQNENVRLRAAVALLQQTADEPPPEAPRGHLIIPLTPHFESEDHA